MIGILLAVCAWVPAADSSAVLTLDAAVERALIKHPQIASINADYRAGEARVGSARSGYLPKLDANAQYQRTTANFVISPVFANSPLATSIAINNRLSPSDTVGYFLFTATASQLIYDFGRTGSALDQARAGVETRKAELTLTRENVVLNVRVAYFSALAAAELIRLAEATLANQERHLQQVRQFVAAGTRPKIDAATSELSVSNAKLTLLRARNAYALALVQLNQSMGEDGEQKFYLALVPENANPDEEQNVEALFTQALTHRGELAAYAARREQSEASRRLARAAYFPSVSAAASLTAAKVENFNAGANWYAGVGLSWNLFSGLNTYHQTNEADAMTESLRAQEELAALAIRTDIERQLLSVHEARERMAVTAESLKVAVERLRLAEGRYQAGAGDLIELEDAQVARVNAEAQQVQSHYDLAITRARLSYALGKR